MEKWKGTGGKATSVPVGLMWGMLTSLGVTIGSASLLAWLVLSGKMGQENIGYGIMFLLLVSSFTGAKVSYRKIQRQRLVISMTSGLLYFVGLLSITAMFFGGQYSGVGETALMVLCGAAMAVLVKKKGSSGLKAGKRKMAYR